jgi:hypothetical protein
MGSVTRRMRKRKRCLGEVRVLRREEYEGLELNVKVEMIRSLLPLGLMHVQMLLEEEVEALAGPRYAHADGTAGTRHGSNPGTVVLDGQRVRIRVPRVRSEQAELPLRSYPALHGTGVADVCCTGSRAATMRRRRGRSRARSACRVRRCRVRS